MDRPTLRDFAVLVLLALHLANPHLAAARTIFVDCDAIGFNNGSSWSNAYRHLRDALAHAHNGDNILVAQGVYKPDLGYGVNPGDRMATFRLTKGVVLEGGYPGLGEAEPNLRDINRFETVLSGDLGGDDTHLDRAADLPDELSRYDNSYNVIAVGWLDQSTPPPDWTRRGSMIDYTTILDGFTITGGYANLAHDRQDCGGGMYCNWASPTVQNCTFLWNYATYGPAVFTAGVGYFVSDDGGLQTIWASEPNITNCTFRYNYRAAVANREASPNITDCLFEQNEWGAIENDRGSPRVVGCRFIGNSSSRGAGIETHGGELSVRDCLFEHNHVTQSGGAIYCEDECEMTITGCTFHANSGDHGSATENHYSNVAIEGCAFVENAGDVIRNYETSAAVTGCAFSGNSGVAIHNRNSTTSVDTCALQGNDGGMINRNSDVTVMESSFTENRSIDGGAVGNIENTDASFLNCRFISNAATNEGGALYIDASQACLTNCVLLDNASSRIAGAIYVYDGSNVDLANCTVAGNSNRGGAVACDSFRKEKPSRIAARNSIFWNMKWQIENNDDSTIEFSYCDVEGGWPGIGNINADPCLALSGDYHLTGLSPCIDAGGALGADELPETDIDGNPRIADGNSDGNAMIDIGAHEFAPDSSHMILSSHEFFLIAARAETTYQTWTLLLRNAGGRPLQWRIIGHCPWLTITPVTGICTNQMEEITLTLEPVPLEPGLHHCRFAVSDTDAPTNQATVEVHLYVPRDLHVPTQYDTIQAALDAGSSGDMVIVGPGVYRGPGNRDLDFQGKNITVRSTDPDDWEIVSSTVIDCQSTEDEPHRGFYFHSGEDANSIVAGLTITNARAKYGAAIRCESQSSPTMTKCLLTHNTAYWGAGISSQESSPTVDNCVIVDNISYDCGVHLYTSGHPIITNCTIAYNLSEREPPSVWFSQPDATISDCIMWFNSIPRDPLAGTFTCCNIQGGRPGIGNIDADPLFADPANGDYHLSPDSPCIDAGDPNYFPFTGQTDIDGQPRVFNGRIDMGADELVYNGPLIALTQRRFEFSAYEGRENPEPQNLAIYNRGFDTLTWQITEECPWLEVTPAAGASSDKPDEVTLSADISGLSPGLYECQLTISDPAAENSPRTVPVTLYVLGPVIDLSAPGFDFIAEEGGPNPEEQTLVIRNGGGGSLRWAITPTCSCDWLHVGTAAGVCRDDAKEIILMADASALSRGPYSCQLTVSDPNSVNSPQTVDVHLYVTAELVRVPSEFPTIQQAVDYVLEGGTVLVADGTHTGPGNRDIDFQGKAITVRSENGPERCIIDCNSTYQAPHLGLWFCSGEDASSVLRGFTITRAALGILCTQATGPTIDSCFVIGNAVNDDLWAPASTGGIRCENNSAPLITDCHITGNRASDGGGLSCYSSSPTVRNCFFSGNLAYGCPICRRIIPGDGGGIFCSESNPTIENCAITNNCADLGGGMCCRDSNPIIKNCLIAGNGDWGSYADRRDTEGGAGVYCDASDPIITNCTFASNIHAVGSGGAICSINGSHPTISNCVLWDNEATHGSEIAIVTLEHYSGEEVHSAAAVSYSDIQGGAEALHVESGCQLHWGLGNIDADPLFAEPGHWESSGSGWSQTYTWFDGDYHMKSQGWRWDQQRRVWTWDDVTSSCIDAGNPGSSLGDELFAIPEDPDGEWGKNVRINMGAYGCTAQASLAPPGWSLLSDLTNDRTTAIEDLAAWAQTWLCAENISPGDLDRNGVVDFSDFGLLAHDWLERTTR